MFCSDVSEEHVASVFRVNVLVQVDAALSQLEDGGKMFLKHTGTYCSPSVI
jgi:hypothetical protein